MCWVYRYINHFPFPVFSVERSYWICDVFAILETAILMATLYPHLIIHWSTISLLLGTPKYHPFCVLLFVWLLVIFYFCFTDGYRPESNRVSSVRHHHCCMVIRKHASDPLMKVDLRPVAHQRGILYDWVTLRPVSALSCGVNYITGF